MPDTMTPEEFLERLWSFNEAPPGSFHMISVKDGDNWVDAPYTKDPPVHDNLFFTPTPFKKARRTKECAIGKTPWLYADLDEVNPAYLEIKPQLAWETSPGRYQCAWRLDIPLGIRAQERLNKAMTYHCSADKGGWSWTKALRVPGSTSLKRDDPAPVTLLWADWSSTLALDHVRGIVKAALPPLDVAAGPIRLPKQSAREIRREHWKDFSPRLRKLLRAKVVHSSDDRSGRLWEIEGLLLEARLTPGQAVRVAQDTVWNKYKGQQRELRKLMEEVGKQKILYDARQVERKEMAEATPNVEFGAGMEPESEDRSFYAKAELDLLGPLEKPDYVIKNVLARGQVLVLSADSGVGKSWVALDLVRACITRTKWLGRSVTGRKAIYVDEENGLRILNGRLRGLMLKDNVQDEALQRLVSKNLHLCSRNGVSIGDPEQQEELEGVITALAPSLLIIDTAMSATNVGEVNDNTAVVDLMKRLRYLAEKYHLGVVLMHHDRKPPQGEQHEDIKGVSMMGARQWSGQADAHLSLQPYESKVKPLPHGKRGLVTDVILACPKLRDDVPFYNEHIRIASIKDAGGRILKASVKCLGPAPEPLVSITDATPDQVDLQSPPPPSNRGLSPLDRMISGEVLSLREASLLVGATEKATRTRVHRSTKYIMDKHEGKAIVRRL